MFNLINNFFPWYLNMIQTPNLAWQRWLLYCNLVWDKQSLLYNSIPKLFVCASKSPLEDFYISIAGQTFEYCSWLVRTKMHKALHHQETNKTQRSNKQNLKHCSGSIIWIHHIRLIIIVSYCKVMYIICTFGLTRIYSSLWWMRWDEIIYLFPNFNGCTIEVCEWMSISSHPLKWMQLLTHFRIYIDIWLNKNIQLTMVDT